MNSKLLTILSSFLVAAIAAPSPQAGDVLTINTPVNVVSCDAVLLTWQGGAAPYSLTVWESINSPIADLGVVNTQSVAWDPVTAPGGTSVFFQVRDSEGLVAQSAAISVTAGADTSCL